MKMDLLLLLLLLLPCAPITLLPWPRSCRCCPEKLIAAPSSSTAAPDSGGPSAPAAAAAAAGCQQPLPLPSTALLAAGRHLRPSRSSAQQLQSVAADVPAVPPATLLPATCCGDCRVATTSRGTEAIIKPGSRVWALGPGPSDSPPCSSLCKALKASCGAGPVSACCGAVTGVTQLMTTQPFDGPATHLARRGVFWLMSGGVGGWACWAWHASASGQELLGMLSRQWRCLRLVLGGL